MGRYLRAQAVFQSHVLKGEATFVFIALKQTPKARHFNCKCQNTCNK